MTMLLIVDTQNDFVSGSLGVPQGEVVAQRIADLIRETKHSQIVLSADWHIDPGTHFSDTPDFVDTWPRHCVAETWGAQLHPAVQEALAENKDAPVRFVHKGEYEAAYSVFEGHYVDDGAPFTGAPNLVVAGIATEHCVLATVNDALTLGNEVTVLTDYVAAVDEAKGLEALTQMEASGATLAARKDA